MKRKFVEALLVVLLVSLISSNAFGSTDTTLVGVTIGTTAAGTTQVAVTTSGVAFTVGGSGGSSLYQTGSTTPIYTDGPGISGLAIDRSGNVYLVQGTEVNEITNPPAHQTKLSSHSCPTGSIRIRCSVRVMRGVTGPPSIRRETSSFPPILLPQTSTC